MKLLSVKDLKKELLHLKQLLKPVSKEVYVFGSVLKGAVPMESDLDVLVVPKKKLGYKELYSKAASALDEIIARGLAPHLIIATDWHKKTLMQSAGMLKLV